MKEFNIVSGATSSHYHEAALTLGMSDAKLNVLYELSYEGSAVIKVCCIRIPG